MRTRIRKYAYDSDVWVLEVKYWWSTWIYQHACGSKATAIQAAEMRQNPVIIEATK